MADGRVVPITDVRPGDHLYGTHRDRRRRYAVVEVTAHVLVSSSIYGIKLADGTELVAGADQCVLTYRGWKHVTGTEQGRQRRSHLTHRGMLLGTGHFATSPAKSQAYRRGYLCGLIRGDGHVGSYVCRPAGRATWVKHGFRLALTDEAALDRAGRYLTEMGVDVRRFAFEPGTATRRPIEALGNQSRGGVDRVRRVIHWPTAPADEWRLGFLAGIFDAEGSSGGTEALRICNTDPEILGWIESCLSRLRFDAVRETTTGRNGVCYIRIRGGLRERLRFFHSTDPAISRKRSFSGLALQSDADLRVVSIEPRGGNVSMHALTTTSGDLIADGVVVGAGAPGL